MRILFAIGNLIVGMVVFGFLGARLGGEHGMNLGVVLGFLVALPGFVKILTD